MGKNTNSDYLVALIVNIVLLAILTWFALRWAGLGATEKPSPTRVRLLLLGAVLPLNSLVSVFAGNVALLQLTQLRRLLGGYGLALLVCAMASLAVFAIAKYPSFLARATGAFLLLLSPAVVFLLVAAYDTGVWAKQVAKQDRPSIRGSRARTRIVWLLFDEWDYSLSFENRLKGLDLPEMDRLHREALSASRAIPPSEWTIQSVPSLLTGERVKEFGVGVDGRPILHLEGRLGDRSWPAIPNLFSKARDLGLSAGVVGWYLPYCELLAGMVDKCYSERAAFITPNIPQSVSSAFIMQLRQLAETRNYSPWGQPVELQSHSDSMSRLRVASVEMAGDAGLDIVFLHLPPLHRPYVYCAETNTFTLRGNPVGGYRDALVLADQWLGEILNAIDRSAAASRTTLIASSDHWCRVADFIHGTIDRRVPFMIRTPDKMHGEYSAVYRTIETEGLIVRLASNDRITNEIAGQLMTAAQK